METLDIVSVAVPLGRLRENDRELAADKQLITRKVTSDRETMEPRPEHLTWRRLRVTLAVISVSFTVGIVSAKSSKRKPEKPKD